MDEQILELAITFIEQDDYITSVYKCTRLLKGYQGKSLNEILEKIKRLNHVELATLEVLLDKLN